MSRFVIISCLALSLFAVVRQAAAGAIPVVAAENFYGDVARQIGGNRVSVTSILRQPNQDPHLFQLSARVARNIAAARVIIVNGAGYDPWIGPLLNSASGGARQVIVAANLMHVPKGANPHIWYRPQTMIRVARRLASILGDIDPRYRAFYRRRVRLFEQHLQPLRAKIESMHARYAGTPVAATEPVFGYMAQALGLKMLETGFQTAMMNGVDPSVSQVIRFDADLRHHRVRVLIYNRQVSDRKTERLKRLARRSAIPIVGVTETQPAGLSYQGWMSGQLQRLAQALAKGRKSG